MDAYSTVTQKGQVTIPIEYREKLGLQTGNRVVFLLKDKEILLKPAPSIESLSGYFKSNKKFDKKKAREAYMPKVLRGEI